MFPLPSAERRWGMLVDKGKMGIQNREQSLRRVKRKDDRSGTTLTALLTSGDQIRQMAGRLPG